MLIVEHTVETTATPAQIWKVWEDVEHWNSWDHGLEFSTLDGPFQTGTLGKLKPKGGPVLCTQLTHVTPMESFIDEAQLPGTKITMLHAIKTSGEKTYVTQRVEMRGILCWFFAFFIGRDIKKNLSKEMESMLRKAKSLA